MSVGWAWSAVIDWLTLRLFDTDVRVDAGRVMSIDADGVVEWQTEKRFEVQGSHSAVVSLRSVPSHLSADLMLEVSGNPAKWFQGHNVFGTDDLQGLVVPFALSVIARAGLVLSGRGRILLEDGTTQLTRIDGTQSWDFGNERRAIAAVQAISELGHLKHRGRGSLLAEGTCYFGKGSRRLSGKVYAKGLELRAHQLPPGLPMRDELHQLAAGLVRFEWTMRSMWLRDRGLSMVKDWATLGVTAEGLHASIMADLNLSDATMREPAQGEHLAPRMRIALQAWEGGADLRAILPKHTFYRYRRAILPLGIDIAVKRPSEASNVVRLVPVLTGKPFEVPDWARGTTLYFEPRQAA